MYICTYMHTCSSSSHQLSVPSHNVTFGSISCFSAFRSKSSKFITYQYPWIPVTSYFQTSSKDILLSVSLPPFSCPPCPEYFVHARPIWHIISDFGCESFQAVESTALTMEHRNKITHATEIIIIINK